ncbi:MAG: prepilin-type N-terminal cleavage/methylation domain-containing protein [Candidatus Omnitrophica bacterium]|nr:prepilin-type N-terminal cleavage/methylation domain-containing protein [Candidatus Omnitrophota bacterium]
MPVHRRDNGKRGMRGARRRMFTPGVAGFTLLEMAVVLSILALAATAVTANFFAGMKLWGRVNEADTFFRQTLLSFEAMAREFRQYPRVAGSGVQGSADEVAFVTARRNGLERITYQYDAAARRLSRRAGDYQPEGSPADALPRVQSFELSFDGFALSYLVFDPEEKRAVWESSAAGNSKVLAIKIQAERGDESVEKMVFFP